MSKTTNPLPSVQVSCEVCMAEIPASEAKSEEAADYVIFFCGLECYESWSTQGNEESESSVKTVLI